MTWDESFHLKGMRSGGYREQYNFITQCRLCQIPSSEFCDTAFEAKIQHFKHCSKVHGYVFEEDSSVQQAEGSLQQAIIDSMLYDLPMPGYESHKSCVKQFRGDKPVCIVHY